MGRVARVIGPVVDIEFPADAIPEIYNALTVDIDLATRGEGVHHIAVETPVKLTEHQRKLLKELEESLKKGGAKHSPSEESWADKLKGFFSA